VAQIVDRRPVAVLQPHPENARIYGDAADEGLVASVREKGILNPLLITPSNLVISGHRRLDAAKRAGLPEVPIVVFASTNELDILEALLESNRQRAKDGEQIGREFEAALGIETERAKQAQREHAGTAPGKSKSLPVNSQEVKKPPSPRYQREAKTRAAKRIGVSQQKAERASTINKVVGRLKEQGEDEAAEKLRKALKTESVNKAWTQARARDYLSMEPVPLVQPGMTNLLVTLPVWHGLTAEQQRQVLNRPGSGSTFNAQKSTDIEWAQWSWNPVTGCKHDCSYCYARDIAERSEAFPQKFVPTFLPERLAAPSKTRVPERAQQEAAYRNVFTCSMADLFGRWVPREWIDAVLTQVRAHREWNFLFLTKFPIRLQEFDFPDNAWVGTTVDAQARVANAERAFEKVRAKVKWLSCEPLLEPLRFSRLGLFQWVVLGGASASTQTPAWTPPRSWVADIWRQATEAGLRIYDKDNLRMRDYPGQERTGISVPDAFKMGYLQRDVLAPEAYAVEVTA
jgi:protein gp37/ParB-like chromosome segregation protein Spo0J